MANRSRSRRGREIESLRWDGGGFTQLGFGAGTAAGAQITADEAPPETIMRIRGEILCWADGASAPGISAEIGFGLLLVPEGSAGNVTVSPITDSESPWLLYERFTIGYEEMVTDVIDVPGITSYRKVIDSKAMRIIRPNVEVQSVLENVTVQAAMSVNFRFNLRVLFGNT